MKIHDNIPDDMSEDRVAMKKGNMVKPPVLLL